MRCVFCEQALIGSKPHFGQPVTVPGVGVAHTLCAQQDRVQKRVFGPLRLKDVPTESLLELKELVLAEINQRQGVACEIELF